MLDPQSMSFPMPIYRHDLYLRIRFSIVLAFSTLSLYLPAAELRFSLYMVAHSVQSWPTDKDAQQKSMDTIRNLGVSRVILESYRSGMVVAADKLREVRDSLESQGFQVMGGIATLPGEGFGVKQNEKLGWLNWQNPKTGQDLERVMRTTAPLFKEYVVDDFLCTADTGPESEAARQGRPWPQYRMDLLSEMARTKLIQPAKEANPGIRVIIKYPQWYDRFHLFGYDVVREPVLFDQVWVGTETRGQYTQRYGFVQPYEGFISFRWMRSLSGNKLTAAWFDHGDCQGIDFLEQAYQSVLAGATDLIIFNYLDVIKDHPGDVLVKQHTPELRRLAEAVAQNPVTGIPSYKPPHSDAGGDLYLMDYLGMLGVPLIPTAQFPEQESTIFLPTQAAADQAIAAKLQGAMKHRPVVILTSGFLARAEKGQEIAGWAGVQLPSAPAALLASQVYQQQKLVEVLHGLDLEMDLKAGKAKVLLMARTKGKDIPFLLSHETRGVTFYVINVHTFSQPDFDAVGEVLLCPRELGLLEIPESWANTLRTVFNQRLDISIAAPTRVALQPLGNSSLFLHNYNRSEVTVQLTGKGAATLDSFRNLNMPPRSRLWLHRRGVRS